MFDSVCEHIWLIPPAALERKNWRKKFRIKCKLCSTAKTVWGEFAIRMASVREEPPEPPKPPPPPKEVPAEYDFSDRKQGWGGEYLFGDKGNGTAYIAAHFVKVKEGDTILVKKGERYVVRRVPVPWEKNSCWVAEVERALI